MTSEFDRFTNEVISAIPGKLPEEIRDSRISIEEKMKNNDIRMHGIAIQPEGMSAVPLFYLENYYGDYLSGRSAEEIAEQIVSQFREYSGRASAISVPDLSFSSIKGMLRTKLVNSRSNADNLTELVSRPAGCGFSLTAYIDLPAGSGVEGMIQVTKQLALTNGYDPDAVMDAAIENSAVYEPATLTEINDVLYGDGENDLLNGAEYDGSALILVLSRKSGEFGAAALFYSGVQDRIAELLGEDYYVLPSSVHEVLIIPGSNDVSEEKLMHVVETANCAELSAEDKLADKVFLYRRDLGRLTVVKDREREKISERESI